MSRAAERAATIEFRFNPWDEDFRRNPYPHYQPLFSVPPPVFRFFIPTAVVARYSDVAAVLRDHRLFSSAPIMTRMTRQGIEVFGAAPTVLSSDPPVHTRLRRLVSRDFTPRRIRELEPRMREITARLLDAIAKKGEFDLMADLAVPLPVTVIAEMLGIPGEKYETFKRWSDMVIESSNVPPGTPMPQIIRDNFVEMRDYFAEEIEKRRRRPGHDLMSALVAAHDEAEALSSAELMQFLVLLLLAGNETTTNLLGNGMLALAQHPEQMELLRREPSLLAPAIEEMLRYDGPVQALFRAAREDTEIGGTAIEKGSGVFLLVAAANRDPARFPQPDAFDITRDPNGHLAFGEGPLLHRRAAGADGSGNRHRIDAEAFSANPARRAGAEAELQGFVLRQGPGRPADDGGISSPIECRRYPACSKRYAPRGPR